MDLLLTVWLLGGFHCIFFIYVVYRTGAGAVMQFPTFRAKVGPYYVYFLISFVYPLLSIVWLLGGLCGDDCPFRLCTVLPSLLISVYCVPCAVCPQCGSWVGFTVMTQCVPVAIFSLVGFIQMAVWARGKHRSYLKEFHNYPTLRSSILPFIL